MIRVFVDTSIARFAENKRTEWEAIPKTVQWGPTTVQVAVHAATTHNPLDRLDNEREQTLYQDALRIPLIDELAKHRLVTLLWHFETHWEFIRHRKTLKHPVPEFVTRIETANCPIYYGRQLVSPFKNEDAQMEFLRHLKHPGFDKWKKAVGVVAGSKKERNQLMDAWNLWSAEHNHCEYFLTMDYRLIDSVASRNTESNLRIVTPAKFLEEFRLLRPAAEREKAAFRAIQKDMTPGPREARGQTLRQAVHISISRLLALCGSLLRSAIPR